MRDCNPEITDRTLFLRISRWRSYDNADVAWKCRKKCTAAHVNYAACICYSRGIMRSTFIGQLATPRSQSLNYSPVLPEASQVYFNLAPDCSSPSLSPAPPPSLHPAAARLHPVGLFRFLAFLSSAREIYKADQEFPAPQREKKESSSEP